MAERRVLLELIVFQLMALAALLTWTKIYSGSHTVKHKLKVTWIGTSAHNLTSLDIKSLSGKQVYFPLIFLSKHHVLLGRYVV